MGNEKMTKIRDYIVKNSKFVFPVILIVAVAATVSLALNMGNERAEEESPVSEVSVDVSASPQPVAEATPEPEETSKEISLTVNEDEAINAIIASYYEAMASGDSEKMAGIYDQISENDLLRYEETAKYLSSISTVDIYTKPGLDQGTTVVYVYYKLCFLNHEQEEVPGWQTFYICDNKEGGLLIKNEESLTDAEKDYIVTVSAQDDVVEFNNRVSVEYNDLATAHPELLSYMGELGKQVNATIGVRLAEQNAGEEGQPAEGGEGGESTPEGEAGGEGTPEGGGTPEEPAPSEEAEGGEAPAEQPEAPADMGPRYATATTTVNVRSSDSEQADKLGKVAGGEKVQVQEVRVNGWSKIVFEGGDGYIKSEYLHMEESADGQTVIGTVTANENVKIRASASQDGEQLGLMVGGDSLELLANEDGWCKVIYNGKIGYVKAEYVTQQ